MNCRTCTYFFLKETANTKTWSKFPNVEKSTLEQKMSSEGRSKSKGTGLRESQLEIHIGRLTILVMLFDI